MIVRNTANGEGIFLIGWGIWLICCLGLGLLFPVNRERRSVLRLSAGLGLTALAVDLGWLAMFFPGGEYVNRGAAGGLLSLLGGGAVMLAAVMVLSAVNHCRKGEKS